MQPEKELQNFCYKQLCDKKIGGQYRTFGNYNKGIYKNKKGTFDSLISCFGKMVWIEFKIHPNKPSKEQKDFQKWLYQNCQKGYVIYGVSEFAKVISYLQKNN